MSCSQLSDVCLLSAIERNLESEEQERVSADMRIRKSQVNHVRLTSPPRVAVFFLRVNTFLMQKVIHVKQSHLLIGTTMHVKAQLKLK